MTEQQTFTIDQLAVSPLNVRFNEEDCKAVDALAASIVEEGLIHGLTLHTIEGEPEWARLADGTWASFGVYAGGRRSRAIRKAVDDGRLARDYPIAGKVRDLPEAEIILLSLEENLHRRELRGYEVHRAIARAAQCGLSPEQISAKSGQAIDWVRRQLRLGELAPEIFQAYVCGSIDVEQAQAFGATDDHDLQRAAFDHLLQLPTYHRSPSAVRTFMKVGDAELKRLLLFVGETVYRGRGGRFELDLFAAEESDRGRIVDESLLRELAEERMAGLRDQVRALVGERDLRFQPAPPTYSGYTDQSLRIDCFDGAKPPSRSPVARHPVESVVAVIEIEREGEWACSFWWASRAAKGAADKKSAPKGTSPARSADFAPSGGEALHRGDTIYGDKAHEIVRDEHGLTKDGLQVMRSLRTGLLRGLLLLSAKRGESVARDYLTWAQLREALGKQGADSEEKLGARGLSREEYAACHGAEPRELVKPYLAEQNAGELWADAIEQVKRCQWITLEDHVNAFRAYLDAPESEKRTAEAVLAGLALVRSANSPGWQVAVHDALAIELDGSDDVLRLLFKPTPGFAGQFTKMKRLEIAQPFVGREQFKGWKKLKDKDLSNAVAGVLQKADGACNWIHPLLTFGLTAPDDSTKATRSKAKPRPSKKTAERQPELAE